LLDVGTSKYIVEGRLLHPKPGSFGTIGYLAPESELEDYGCSINIWAMGVILFELTYGYHPWKFPVNPWRSGEDNKSLRSEFQKRYQDAIMLMARDYKSARASRYGYIHRKCRLQYF
jgi:serine/threonine protein kinase